MCTVSIIDNIEDRRKTLAAGFRAKGCSVNEYHSGMVIMEHSVDLLCVHYRDDWPDVLKISRLIAVYYGGGGEPDPDWLTRRDQRPHCYRYWRRPISESGVGSLTSDEIAVLVSYASAISHGKADVQVPAFLHPPPDYTTLIALSILCQGYLAARAPEELGLDEPFKKSIKEAGAKEKVESARAGWWLDVFSFSEEDVDKAVGRLREALEKEWTQSDEKKGPIEKLLSSITPHSNVEVEVVKSALNTISDFLKTQES